MGIFSRYSLTDEQVDDPWASGAPEALDERDVPVAVKAPPPTQARSLGKLLQVQTPLIDVDIEGEVVRDGKGGVASGAVTRFTKLGGGGPGYVVDDDGKITRFSGKLRFKGKVSIQTRYASDAKATDLSCYGRGTTIGDRRSGDITLGFHESCHQADFASYLKNHPLPNPPQISIGMLASDYDAQLAAFLTAVESYWNDMEQTSHRRTDEVGHRKSEVERTGQCYVHLLP